MSQYYECDNILNNCCDKYKKKCHKKRKRHKRKRDSYGSYDLGPYGSLPPPNPYNYMQQNPYLPSYNSGSYDNILILLLIIVLLSCGNSNECCEY